MNTGHGCANDPGVDRRRQHAKCHMCGEVLSCGFCNICCHWFCDKCRPNVFARAMEAVKEMVSGAKAGCCGPVKAMWNLQVCDLVHADAETVTIRSAADAEPLVIRKGTHGLIIDPTPEEINLAYEHLASGAFGVLP